MTTQTLRILLSALLTSSLVVFAGCGDDHDHDDHDHSHDNNHNHSDEEEHACVHFTGGPAVSVDAVATASETAPETFQEHTRIDITVPDGADTAIVQWTAEEAGDFEFFLSKDVTFALMDGATALSAESSGGPAKGCETAAVASYTFEVEAKTYMIQIGPGVTAGETISFVAEHAGEHAHD